MGKNKKSKIVYEDLELDSKEELEFIYWLNEGKDAGLIKSYIYQPPEYLLFDKIVVTKRLKKGKKEVDKEVTLLNSHIYSPDFNIFFSDKFLELCKNNEWNKIFKVLENDKPLICDIKGSFSRNGGDRSFSINQKWMYQKYGIYINKIVPADLFKITWVPELARLTPKKKQIVEKYKNIKSLNEILKG